MSNLIGSQLGPYDIFGPLGKGGMATVYRARHVTTGFEVALKVIAVDSTRDDELVRRFEREFRTVTALSHPHILRTYGYGLDAGTNTLYLAMEMLPSGDLAERIRRRLLSLQEVSHIVDQLASALSYAHEREVVHRDLKPHNVLFDANGNAILADFGIAKVIGQTTLTQTGSLVGTPAYMSPEQWQGEEADPRSDVYSLGIMIFEMLVGYPPFRADSPANMMHRHIYDKPPSIRRLKPELPAGIGWVIDKALAKHRENRIASAKELADLLRTVVTQTEESVPSLKIPDEPLTSPAPQGGSMMNEPTVIVPISKEQATSQEQRALESIRADMAQRQRHEIESHHTTINIPPQDVGDRFTNRIKEQADMVNLLAERTRLISIYGRGGVGKTALACKVLNDLRQSNDGRPDGLVYLSAVGTGISLDRIFSDTGKLLSEAARRTLDTVWSNTNLSTKDKVIALLHILGEGKYVLLLDNMETLQDQATGDLLDPDMHIFFETVLAQGGNLQIVLTSREPLNLPRLLRAWERLIPLEEGLPAQDAVLMLRTLDPDGVAGLRHAPDHVLLRLASKLRGFPRALEAVAGLLLEDALLTVDDVINDDKLLLGEITPVIVQQAIERLNPESIRVLEALAIFERPATLPALTYLLSPYLDTDSLRSTLNRLVRSYYVSFNRVTQAFVLHPIDRAYCYQRIPEGTLDDWRTSDQMPQYTRYALHHRAARYYVHKRSPQESWTRIDDLEPQLAEFDQLINAGDYDSAAALLDTIDTDYLARWGHYPRIVIMHECLQDKIVDKHLAQGSAARLGSEYLRTGRGTQAILMHQRALQLAQEIQDRRAEGIALGQLGSDYHVQGQNDTAVHYLEQALTIAREVQDRYHEGGWLNALGNMFVYRGQMEVGLNYLHQALTVNRITQNRPAESNSLANLAIAHDIEGRMETAIDYARQALDVARLSQDRAGEGIALGLLGNYHFTLGEVMPAIDYLQQALAIHRETYYRRYESYRLADIAAVLIQLGHHQQAIDSLKAAIAIADEMDLAWLSDSYQPELAEAYLFGGDLTAALAAILTVRDRDIAESNHLSAALYGIILARMGQQVAAQKAFKDSVEHTANVLSHAPGDFSAYYVRGLAHSGLVLSGGDPHLAIEDYRTARSLRALQGVVAHQVRLLDALMLTSGGEQLAGVRTTLVGTD